MKYFCFLCALLMIASAALAQNHFVYTDDNVNTGEGNSVNTVSGFLVSANGSLSAISGSPFVTGGSGGGNNIDPNEIAVASLRGTSYLYAANDGSGTLAGFHINATTVALTAVPGSPFLADGAPGGDYSLAVSPDGKLLFATEENVTVIHVYAIDATTGALNQLPGSPYNVGANSQGLKVTANGKFLLAGEASPNAVAVYAISYSGRLTPVSGSPFAASGGAYAVDSDCASSLAFVVNAGSPLIDVYSIASNGNLTPVAGEPFSNGTTSTSGGVVFSPANRLLFVSDTFSNDVSSYAVGTDGTLTEAPGSPYATSSWTGGITVTQSGKFVYSSLFTVAQVDGREVKSDGALAAVPSTPFSTGQSQTGVPTVIAYPPVACPAQ
jgi:6-phosphogluconolactonase